MNPLTFDGAIFSWSGRELTQYTKDGKTISFQYDENGLRHRKTVTENGVTTEQYDYVWSDGSLISQTYTNYADEVTTSDTARFIYDSWGTLQGFILNDSETYLYVKNLQGDIIAIVDEQGQTIVEYSYDAWGNVTFSESSLQNMTKASTLCFVSPFTYRGYCYDYDIELYYLQSRYYSPEIGRFINTDDTQIAIATQGEILGANLFAYCNNNPINYTDPSGFKAPVYSCYSYYPLRNPQGGYMITVTLSYKGIRYTKTSNFYKGILQVWNAESSMKEMIKKKILYYFACSLVDASKKISPNALQGRTEKGVYFELLVHYIIYVALIGRKNLTKREEQHLASAKVADIGAKYSYSYGYDKNAKKFEDNKSKLSYIENKLITQKSVAYAVYKLADKWGLLP